MTTRYTPVYSIPVPGSDDKPKDFSDQIWSLGLGVEAALQAASIPGTSNPDIRVSASAAARDSYFGTPATEAARLALQARGATTLRTDKGWTERYYATYNATSNRQGATPAGWYPVAGNLPLIQLRRAAQQNLAVGSGIVTTLWGSTPQRNTDPAAFTFSGGAITMAATAPIGLYEINSWIQFGNVDTVVYTGVWKNATDPQNGTGNLARADARPTASSYATSQTATTERLVPSDVLRVLAFSSVTTVAMGALAWPSSCGFDIRYVGPPIGAAV